MKALFSFALVCAFFSMSSFNVVKHHDTIKSISKSPKLVYGWPVTGTTIKFGGIPVAYEVHGSGQTPSYITFPVAAPGQNFYFTTISSTQWTASGFGGIVLSNTVTFFNHLTVQGSYAVSFGGND